MPPPQKWNVRKGYLKIHVVAVDIMKKKIVSLEVTSEEIHDDVPFITPRDLKIVSR
jgi:hypothetical protein